MKPIRVRSMNDFVDIFGNPIDGVRQADPWRQGNTGAPNYAAYAAQAHLASQTSPVTFIRLLGENDSLSTNSDTQAGWNLGGGQSNSGSAVLNTLAYGLFIMPSASKIRKRKDDKALGQDNRYYINGNKVNLSDNYNKSDSEIRLTYLAVPLSVEGWPMIKEGHEIAVAQYIMWQHKLIDFMNAKLPQYIIKDLESRWYYLCGQVRGRDNMPTPQELEMIGKVWNRKMPIQSLGQLTDL